MRYCLKNIYYLGVKELQGLLRDKLLILLIIYSFSLQLYTVKTSSTDTISDAAVAIIDNDGSQLSKRLVDGIAPPYFLVPKAINYEEIDASMDRGDYTFVIVIPNNFERDVQAGNCPEIQLNVDATRMGQAFTGAGYIQQIFNQETRDFLHDSGVNIQTLAEVNIRNRFNPNLTGSWFDVLMQLANSVTMFAIILTGAALIRERERGTLEHLMVMPVTAFQIMASKVWSMTVVVFLATGVSLLLVVKWWLDIPTMGNLWLFMGGVALHLFAMTAMGIFLACVAESMPQLGMLMILVLLPLQMLSGGSTPRESMPDFVQNVMLLAPTTHFNIIAQGVLFRGANLLDIWKEYLWIAGIGSVFYTYSLSKFRKSL